MPKADVFIDIVPGRPERSAAAFLAVLAYPSDQQKARRFMWAAVAEYVLQRAEQDSEWAWKSTPLEPGLLLVAPRATKIVSDGLDMLLRYRQGAGEMALGLMLEEVSRQTPAFQVRVDGTKPNASRMAEYVGQWLQLGPTSPEPEIRRRNTFSRAWTPSKPVLHLAMAFRVRLLNLDTGKRDLVGLLGDEWVESALEWAEAMRAIMCQSALFNVKESEMLRVLPRRHGFPPRPAT